ncbi:MAG: 30S ribosome-binding factor RbfA [Bacteroidetes bacterium]|nr:30S ribosome-binding factor RbfA [Bacteroidota bacterium]
METQRQQKIGRLLQRDLSEIIQMEMKAVVAGAMVTVTKVTISPDLSLAKVHLSVFASKDKKSLVEKIGQHTREIRGHLGKRVRHQLRIIPDLAFYLDDSLDYIDRIEDLLHE